MSRNILHWSRSSLQSYRDFNTGNYSLIEVAGILIEMGCPDVVDQQPRVPSNIKLLSYQCWKSYGWDKVVLWTTYPNSGISYIGKAASVDWDGGLVMIRR